MLCHSRRVLPAIVGSVLLAWAALPGASTAALRLDVFGAETDAAFRVTSVIVVGPTESVLWDGQYKVSDGKRLADRIAATGTRSRVAKPTMSVR